MHPRHLFLIELKLSVAEILSFLPYTQHFELQCVLNDLIAKKKRKKKDKTRGRKVLKRSG